MVALVCATNVSRVQRQQQQRQQPQPQPADGWGGYDGVTGGYDAKVTRLEGHCRILGGVRWYTCGCPVSFLFVCWESFGSWVGIRSQAARRGLYWEYVVCGLYFCLMTSAFVNKAIALVFLPFVSVFILLASPPPGDHHRPERDDGPAVSERHPEQRAQKERSIASAIC